MLQGIFYHRVLLMSPLSPEKIKQTFAETKYIMDEEKQLRFVVPYDFTHNTFARKRWLGRNLFEVLTTEFSLDLGQANSLKEHAERKRISVNMKPLDLEEIKAHIVKGWFETDVYFKIFFCLLRLKF